MPSRPSFFLTSRPRPARSSRPCFPTRSVSSMCAGAAKAVGFRSARPISASATRTRQGPCSGACFRRPRETRSRSLRARSIPETAYRVGMNSPGRPHFLADTGEDKPENWLWGRPGEEADAVLLVYAADAPTLSEEVSARKADIEQSGGRILHELRPKPLEERDPATAEHGRFRAVRLCGRRLSTDRKGHAAVAS